MPSGDSFFVSSETRSSFATARARPHTTISSEKRDVLLVNYFSVYILGPRTNPFINWIANMAKAKKKAKKKAAKKK